jgi:hypothetical protein
VGDVPEDGDDVVETLARGLGSFGHDLAPGDRDAQRRQRLIVE